MNDDERTEQMPPEEEPTGSTEPTEPQPETQPTEPQPDTSGTEGAGPRRLLRSRDDRMIAGVAGGLASYFNVDPVIFRIGFAVSVFFGGLGILAYLALALFVPSAGGEGEESQAPVQRSRWLGIAAGTALIVVALSSLGSLVFWGDGWGWGDGGWRFGWIFFPLLIGGALYLLLRDREPGRPIGIGRAIAIGVLIVCALLALCVIALGSAYAGATGGGVVIASIVIAIGAMLVVAAFRGGARWLIIPALALSIPLGVVAATDVSFGSGVGEREYRPLRFSEVPDDGYELGIGRLAVDLRDLDWRPNSTLDVDVDLGIGEAIVAVPEDVCVVADAHVGAGHINVAGDDIGGADIDSDPAAGTTATPRVELQGEVDLGEFRVVNDDEFDIDEDHRGFRDDDEFDDDALRDTAVEACRA